MIKVGIAKGEEEIRKALGRSRELLEASGSTLLFNRPEVPLLWWKHFHGRDGADFGTRRGRNFLGVKTRLEEVVFLIAERDGAPCGMAALVASEVFLKANAPPLKLLSFCADSVILFYQDLLVHPDGRREILAALVDALAGLIARENRILFLGYLTEDSPNLPGLREEIAARVRGGAWGGVAENRFRGGVHPWTAHKIADAFDTLKDLLPPEDPGKASLEALAIRLRSQGSALQAFPGTRIALEKEVRETCAAYRERSETADACRQADAAMEGGFIHYPYLKLPATPEAYLESLSSSKRYYFRRYLKKYHEAGGEFECLDPAQVTLADVDEYLDLHVQRWGADSVAVNPATMAFHRELSLEAARLGAFRLFFSKHQGKRISAHVCLDIGKRREYFFSGRTAGSEELRAGKLMVMHTVLDAIQRGFETYDFGYGGDEYKADFTKTFRPARSLFLAPGPEAPDLERLFPKYENLRLETG